MVVSEKFMRTDLKGLKYYVPNTWYKKINEYVLQSYTEDCKNTTTPIYQKI